MQTEYGVKKHTYGETENPRMQLDYDEFELILKTAEFLGLTYDVKTEIVSVKNEHGMIEEMVATHLINIY